MRQQGRTSIAVLPPGADTPRIIIPSGVRPRYVATGHLLYVAGGHLLAVPFDLERLEVGHGATTAIFSVPVLDTRDLRLGTRLRLFAHSRVPGDQPSISADDQRFLMLEQAQAGHARLNLVQNWFEELKVRVPVK